MSAGFIRLYQLLSGMHSKIIDKLVEYAESVFSCGSDSIHGLDHWRRVDESAQLICQYSNADLLVVRFFAFLHDSCRLNDGADLEHGPRAADSLAGLPAELAVLDEGQMNALEYAIRHHTAGIITDDETIGACWDADRLDLGRVGMVPDADLMSTEAGKNIARLGSKGLYRQMTDN